MPRVSEAHMAARRDQILTAARTCFLRNGFHATSMQDVTAEANLSVGAVYRYYAGKNEIVQAIAETAVTQMGLALDKLVHQDPMPSLLEVLDGILGVIDEQTGPQGGFRLAVQCWSEGLRDADLARAVEKTFGVLRGYYVALAERAGLDDPQEAGGVLFALVPGYALQRIYLGTTRADFLKGIASVTGR